MNDLAIIGAGFWGKALYDKATALGMKVLVIDSADPLAASRNAAGIVSLNWYQAETTLPMLPDWMRYEDILRSVDWLQMQWGLQPTPEHFQGPVHYRIKKDSLLLPLQEFHRNRPCVVDRIQRVQRTENHWCLVGNSQYEARCIAICAGYKTDTLLHNSGYGRLGIHALRGRAILYQNAQENIPSFYTQEVSKYRHLTIRTWGTGWRVGDTVEKLPNDGVLKRLRSWAQQLTLSNESRMIEGYRPVLKKMHAELFAPSGVVATGGHRVGLALASAIADRVLRLLGAL